MQVIFSKKAILEEMSDLEIDKLAKIGPVTIIKLKLANKQVFEMLTLHDVHKKFTASINYT